LDFGRFNSSQNDTNLTTFYNDKQPEIKEVKERTRTNRKFRSEVLAVQSVTFIV